MERGVLTREIGGGGGKNSVVWHFLQLLFVENVSKSIVELYLRNVKKQREFLKMLKSQTHSALSVICFC